MPSPIAKNAYLGQKDMQHNALWLYDLMKARASDQAIAAMLGNMQTESTINPGIWESLKPNWRGYGLVQWTPYDKLTDWIQNTYGQTYEQALRNYGAQIARFFYEAENGLQWFRNPAAPIKDPPISFRQFLVSEDSPAQLARYFLWYYEHPADPNQPKRATQAEEWYTFLTGERPPPDPGGHPVKSTFKIIYALRKI